ncbi:hypothetical protein KC315_g25 [Hortaea werneckii]|nr:hypothetical protein KC315_g25 [Hortaea werneckii]
MDCEKSMANPMHGLTYPSAKHSSAVFCATALAATSVRLAKRALIDSMVIERAARHKKVQCARVPSVNSIIARIPGKEGQSRRGRTRECIDRVAKGVDKPPVVDFAVILAQIWYVLAEDMRGSHGLPRRVLGPWGVDSMWQLLLDTQALSCCSLLPDFVMVPSLSQLTYIKPRSIVVA